MNALIFLDDLFGKYLNTHELIFACHWIWVGMTIYSTWHCSKMPSNICWISLHAGRFVNLQCMPQQPSVCAGDEIICFCTAPSNETIFWSDNNTLLSFSPTQVCNSGLDRSSPAHLEVIYCNNPGNFTSRLSYNASLGMGNSTTIIQFGCSIARDPHDFRTWCVTNCTGMYT